MMIKAESALDIGWQISGIFGDGILGLFLLAIFKVKISRTQGIISVRFIILIIVCGTLLRELLQKFGWLECSFDPIIIGAAGTAGLLFLALVFVV